MSKLERKAKFKDVSIIWRQIYQAVDALISTIQEDGKAFWLDQDRHFLFSNDDPLDHVMQVCATLRSVGRADYCGDLIGLLDHRTDFFEGNICKLESFG